MKNNYKQLVNNQRRLNVNMKEELKKEVIKWLDASVIYGIFDNQWVSMHVL